MDILFQLQKKGGSSGQSSLLGNKCQGRVRSKIYWGRCLYEIREGKQDKARKNSLQYRSYTCEKRERKNFGQEEPLDWGAILRKYLLNSRELQYVCPQKSLQQAEIARPLYSCSVLRSIIGGGCQVKNIVMAQMLQQIARILLDVLS